MCAHCDAIYLRVFIVGTRQCGERRRVTESADSFDDEAYPCVQNNWTFFFFSYVFLRLQLGILFTIDAPSLTDPAYDDCDKFHLFFSSYLLTPRIQIFERCRVRETYIPAWLLTIIA